MIKMNSRDLTLSTLKGVPEKIPFNPFIMHLAASLTGVDYCHDYVQKPDVLVASHIKCANFFGIDHLNVSTDAYREASAWGVEMFWEGNTPDAKTVLKMEEFDSIETPDILSSPRILQRIEAVKLMKESVGSSQCIVGWIEAPFAEINCLFGMINVMRIRPKTWESTLESLFKRILPIQKEFAQLQIEAGADIIGVGDSAISQIGPRKYEGECLRSTQDLFASIQKHVPVLYHTCGDNSGVDREGRDMLKLIASTGCDILDLDYQVDLKLAKQKVGRDVCLRGNSNTQILGSDTYSAENVAKEVKQNIIDGKPQGQYMYAAGCEWTWEPLDLAIRNMGIAKGLNEKMGYY
jgi:uroporphyrinogen-III decarboxylase